MFLVLWRGNKQNHSESAYETEQDARPGSEKAEHQLTVPALRQMHLVN